MGLNAGAVAALFSGAVAAVSALYGLSGGLVAGCLFAPLVGAWWGWRR